MPSPREIRRFGPFALDIDAGELRRDGTRIKLQPQPFRLLVLLTSRAGRLISREEIRTTLWPEGTFVDFDQSVNFAVKQIRDALGDSASQPVYLETVPRQGYRFVALTDAGDAESDPSTSTTITVRLQKAIWANIAELRVAEERRRKQTRYALAGMLVVLVALLVYVVMK